VGVFNKDDIENMVNNDDAEGDAKDDSDDFLSGISHVAEKKHERSGIIRAAKEVEKPRGDVGALTDDAYAKAQVKLHPLVTPGSTSAKRTEERMEQQGVLPTEASTKQNAVKSGSKLVSFGHAFDGEVALQGFLEKSEKKMSGRVRPPKTNLDGAMAGLGSEGDAQLNTLEHAGAAKRANELSRAKAISEVMAPLDYINKLEE